MGREVICNCRWGSTSGEVTVLLEAAELVLRRPGMNGPKRRTIPTAAMRDVRVEGPADDRLVFEFEKQTVSLSLGAVEAKIWADALRTNGPGVPMTENVPASSSVQILGQIGDTTFETAIRTGVEMGRVSRPRHRAGRLA